MTKRNNQNNKRIHARPSVSEKLLSKTWLSTSGQTEIKARGSARYNLRFLAYILPTFEGGRRFLSEMLIESSETPNLITQSSGVVALYNYHLSTIPCDF
jgi:hypothetical protein